MRETELLRFTTAGSVDDGKSTLIGRLLFDCKSIFEDQLEAVKKSSERKGLQHIELAHLTDGKHTETSNHVGSRLGMMLLMSGMMKSDREAREWILGFN